MSTSILNSFADDWSPGYRQLKANERNFEQFISLVVDVYIKLAPTENHVDNQKFYRAI